MGGRRQPKTEAKVEVAAVEETRVEVADMEEATYSTILPLNSTVLSGVVPPAPPPPTQSAPRTSTALRVAARVVNPPPETSIASGRTEDPYCTAIMEARERIMNRTDPQNGQRRVKQGIFSYMNIFLKIYQLTKKD